MSFTNMYYKRTVGTPKACFVCFKPTACVLATINTVDFLYTCTTHLTDPGFASPVVEEAATTAPKATPEEIAKTKAEWEAKQKAAKEKVEKAKKDETQEEKLKRLEKALEGYTSGKNSPAPAMPGAESSTPPTPASVAAPTHPKFTLHRDFYAIRQREHRKRKQADQAKELAPRLPGAPRGGM